MEKVSGEEINKIIFSLPNYKALGLDGFGVFHFKKPWHIVSDVVVDVIKNFFDFGKLLKEVNCITIALVPKVTNPTSCNDFRPISYCNTIYKCITKILANRIKKVLPFIISHSQGALYIRDED